MSSTKDYIINDCKVCLNPDILLEYNDKDIRFVIDGMECKEGAWVSGHDLQIHCSPYYSSLSPVSAYDKPEPKDNVIRKEVQSFKEAIEHHLDDMVRYGETDDLGNKTTNNKGIQACKRAIRWAEQQLSPNKQLTFDF